MDEFLKPQANFIRLRNEYIEHGTLVCGYDFDNTVYDYHKKGSTYNDVIELLRDLKRIGCKLVCWTSQKDLKFVKTYLTENNIPFDGINTQGVDLGWETVKPFFSCLLDDRAGLRSAYDDLKKVVNYVDYIILGSSKNSIIKPPHPFRHISRNNRTVVFLAGTIDMGDSENWQKDLCEKLLFDNPSKYLFLNPRRDDRESSWKQSIEYKEFKDQVEWELNAMHYANYIVMNFLPTSKSSINLLELGLFAGTGKLIVCCPDEYYRSRNVHILCSEYNITLFKSYKEFINNIDLFIK